MNIQVNSERLRDKIIHSRDLTALEKRYLESLIERDSHQQRGENDGRCRIMDVKLVCGATNYRKYSIDDRYDVYLKSGSSQNSVIDRETMQDITHTLHGARLIIAAYQHKFETERADDTQSGKGGAPHVDKTDR